MTRGRPVFRPPDLSHVGAFFGLVAVACLALPMVILLSPTDALLITGAAVIIPILVRVDGAPAIFGVAAYPLASLLTNYSSGIGGYKIVMVFTIACWLMGVLAGWQTVRLPRTTLDFAVTGLFLVSLVNILFLSQAGKIGIMQDYAGDLIIYFFLRTSIYTRQRLWGTLVGFAGGAAIAALYGFWRYGTGLVPLEENLNRLSIPGQNINGVGSIMLMTVGITLALVVQERRQIIRLALAGMLVISAVATVLTFSRGAFVGAVGMLAAGLVLSRSRRFRLASFGLAAAAVFGVWTGVAGAFGLSSYVARVTAITTLNYDTTAQRNVLWAMGWQQFQHHWFFGLGIGNFILREYWYPLAYQFNVPFGFFAYPQGAHNFYIGWAVDAGIIGLVFLAIMMVAAVGTIISSTQTARGDDFTQAIGHAVLFAFVGYYVYVASSPEQGYQLPYINVALAGCLGTVAREFPWPTGRRSRLSRLIHTAYKPNLGTVHAGSKA